MNFLEHSKQAIDILRKFFKKAMVFFKKPAIYPYKNTFFAQIPVFLIFFSYISAHQCARRHKK